MNDGGAGSATGGGAEDGTKAPRDCGIAETGRDMGGGWGEGLKLAAGGQGVRGVGVTISRERAAYARGLGGGRPIGVRLQDYRELDEPFDAVFSIGMFEHVGDKNYDSFFEVARRCLSPRGLLLLHSIALNDSRHRSDPWIAR